VDVLIAEMVPKYVMPDLVRDREAFPIARVPFVHHDARCQSWLANQQPGLVERELHLDDTKFEALGDVLDVDRWRSNS
jgi:hypothetical protein